MGNTLSPSPKKQTSNRGTQTDDDDDEEEDFVSSPSHAGKSPMMKQATTPSSLHNDTRRPSTLSPTGTGITPHNPSSTKRMMIRQHPHPASSPSPHQQQQQQQATLTSWISPSTTTVSTSLPFANMIRPTKHQRCIVYTKRYNDFFGRKYPPKSPVDTTSGSNSRSNFYNPTDHWVLATLVDGPNLPTKRSTTKHGATTTDNPRGDDKVLVTVQKDDTTLLSDISIQNVRLLVPKLQLHPADIQKIDEQSVDENDDECLLYPIDFYGRLVTNLQHESTTATDEPQRPLWFCHLHPTHLMVGDQVQVYFQNGNAHIDPNIPNIIYGAWYRGRVSSTSSSSSKNDDDNDTTVDICYDDGDMEQSVPIRPMGHKSHIILLRRGWDRPYWLNHLNCLIYSLGGNLLKPLTGRMVESPLNEEKSTPGLDVERLLQVQYAFQNETLIGALSYCEVAEGAFKFELGKRPNLKKKTNLHTKYIWPPPIDNTKSKTNSKIKATNAVGVATKPSAATKKRPMAKATTAPMIVATVDTRTAKTKTNRNKSTTSGELVDSSGDEAFDDLGEEEMDDDDDVDGANERTSKRRSDRKDKVKEERPRRAATKRPIRYTDLEEIVNADDNADKVEYTPSKRNRHVQQIAEIKKEKHDPSKNNTRTTKQQRNKNLLQSVDGNSVAASVKTEKFGEACRDQQRPRRAAANRDMNYNLDEGKANQDNVDDSQEKVVYTPVRRKRSDTQIKNDKKQGLQQQSDSINNITDDSKTATRNTHDSFLKSFFMDVVVPVDVSAVSETDWTTIVPFSSIPGTTNTVEPSTSGGGFGSVDQNVTAALTMDHSIANGFGKGLHSSDAIVVADLLTFMACRSKMIPNNTMWRSILELNTFGPKLHYRCYPDVQKMTVTTQYMNYILTIPAAINRFCRYIDQEFHAIHWGSFRVDDNRQFTYIQAFCTQIKSNYYMVDSRDIQRNTRPSYERVHATIHAKVCFAEVFIQLLQYQLRPIVMNHHANKKGDTADYHVLPIVRDALHGNRGAKDVLESLAAGCLSTWIQFGLPFVVDSERMHAKANGDLALVHLIQQIGRETMRLTELLGIAISYVSWLYSKETNEGPCAIADILGQIYFREMEKAQKQQHELQSSDMTDATSIVDLAEHEQILKLRFIASIDKNIIPQLRPMLAEQFDVAGAYNILYG